MIATPNKDNAAKFAKERNQHFSFSVFGGANVFYVGTEEELKKIGCFEMMGDIEPITNSGIVSGGEK